MPNLPKVVRDRLAGAPAGIVGQHPDADLLTAFVEGAVTGRERDEVLTHLAACAECREITALAAPETVADQQLVAAAAVPARKWWNVSMLRWAAVSATAVVVLAVGLMVRTPQKQGRVTSDAGRGTGELTALVDKRDASIEQQKNAREESAPADQKARDHLTGPTRRTVGSTMSDKFVVKQQAAKEAEIASSASTTKNAPTPSYPMMARKAAPPAASQAATLQAGTEHQAGATPSRGDTNAAKLAALDGVTVDASTSTTTTDAVSELETAKVRGRSKSADTQRALSKEKKDEMMLANNLERGTSSGSASQKPASTANEARGVGASGPTARPAVELMAAPTSIPPEKVVPMRWTIDTAGQLQRSTDLGKSWQVVSVDTGAHLQALAVLETQLWAGGNGGALYHSVDAGNSWTRVRPVAGQITLDEDITRITLPDAQHVTVTTASSNWASSDGGQTWRKQ